jgi:hypothetical protein
VLASFCLIKQLPLRRPTSAARRKIISASPPAKQQSSNNAVMYDSCNNGVAITGLDSRFITGIETAFEMQP